jgi:hypothetical protein
MREKGGRIQVVNPLTNDVKGTHKTKRQAIAQMRALYANVPDAAMAKRGYNAPTNPALWERAKTEAKKRFTVYPSAYANAWAAKWYKERGGNWRKESDDTDNTVEKDLREWFKEDWVDISKPIRENGQIVGYEACGRSDTSEGGYPKCMPKAKAMALSEDERVRLINRKRQSGMPEDGKPTMTSSQVNKRSMMPSNGQLWSQAKNEAQARFRHLPQTYADSYARWYYREHGGTWTEVNPEQVLPTYNVVAEVQKLERAYMKEEWVDISRPVRDTHGYIVGYHTCTHSAEEHKNGHTCMPRRRALKLTADDRDEILQIKQQQQEENKPIKKYGRYRRTK